MRITEATLDQVESVASYMKDFEQATEFVKVDVKYTTKIYQKMIREKRAAMFILWSDEDEMIGGLGCIIGPDIHYPRTIAVETYWFVKPEHRGGGIKLLEHFENWGKGKCDYVAMIHLADSMPDSLEHLYLRRGYKLTEKHYMKEV